MSKVVRAEDITEPVIRRKTLSAENSATLATSVDFGEYGSYTLDEPVAHGGSGLGPSPLQAVLGALCACEGVTFARTAKEFGFSYSGISFDAAFTINIRGRQGARDVVPHFQSIKIEASVATDESASVLAEVVQEAELRCPVLNLLKDAHVHVDMVWIAQASE